MRATGRPSPSPLSSPAVAIGSLRSFLRRHRIGRLVAVVVGVALKLLPWAAIKTVFPAFNSGMISASQTGTTRSNVVARDSVNSAGQSIPL